MLLVPTASSFVLISAFAVRHLSYQEKKQSDITDMGNLRHEYVKSVLRSVMYFHYCHLYRIGHMLAAVTALFQAIVDCCPDKDLHRIIFFRVQTVDCPRIKLISFLFQTVQSNDFLFRGRRSRKLRKSSSISFIAAQHFRISAANSNASGRRI